MVDAILAGQCGGRPCFMAAPTDKGSGDGLLEKPSVLIVEDDFLVASAVESALSDAGYRVVGIAISASEAISLAKLQRPRIAVMDVRLGGDRDGVDTALELFRDYNVRCLFATAHIDGITQARARPASPLGWLGKPYSPDELLEMLAKSAAD